MRLKWFAAVACIVLGWVGGPTLAQPSGGPPKDVFVEAQLSAEGIALSPATIQLDRGAYYRLNLVCLPSDQGDPNFTFETDPLVRNAHLRVLTVDNIEVYVQGLSFRALQCEGEGAVKFSFYPLRAGTYEIHVSDENLSGSFFVNVE